MPRGCFILATQGFGRCRTQHAKSSFIPCFTGQRDRNDSCICGNNFGQAHWQSSQQTYLWECSEVCCLCCWTLLGKNSSWEGAGQQGRRFPYHMLVYVVLFFPHNSPNFGFSTMKMVLDVTYHGLLISIVCALKLFASKLMMIHSVILDFFLYG